MQAEARTKVFYSWQSDLPNPTNRSFIERALDRANAARLWFDEEYVPVVEMLREADMLGSGTETDAYMRVSGQRYRLMRTHEWSEDVLARVREDERER